MIQYKSIRNILYYILFSVFALVILPGCEELPDPPVGNTNYEEGKLPRVETGSISNVSFNTADVEGYVTETGNRLIEEHGHCFSRTGIPDTNCLRTKLGSLGPDSDMSFVSEVEGLKSESTYNVRAYAVNERGVQYGQIKQLTTSESPYMPEVETGSFKNITDSSASVTGNILAVGNGSISKHGHCWSMTGMPDLRDGFNDLGSTSMEGEFTSTITSLNAGQTYYIRAYAINNSDTAYGEQISFYTNPAK